VLEKLAYLTVKDKEGEGNKNNIEEQSENLSGEVLLRGSLSYRCVCFFQHIYYIISIFVFVKLAA
ncbi:hypothetical protein ABHC33_11750, partial [Ruminococcus bicirculans (ex Wegman et al. 2014)]